jgi:photosystem II stability/assembly factor-like uncharacterized protein
MGDTIRWWLSMRRNANFSDWMRETYSRKRLTTEATDCDMYEPYNPVGDYTLDWQLDRAHTMRDTVRRLYRHYGDGFWRICWRMNEKNQNSGRFSSLRYTVSLGTAVVVAFSFGASPFVRAATEDEETATKFGISAEVVRQIRESEGLTREALQRISPAEISRLVWRLQHPDLPRQRAEFRSLQEQDEKGEIPPDALRTALQQLRQSRKGLLKSTVAGLPVGTSVDPARLFPLRGGLDKAGWMSLGPVNVGGRTRSIILHPSDPLCFWLGSAGGGIWQTVDGGKHFSPVDDFMASLAVTSIVMHPTNPKVILAATGEGVNGPVPRGAGIFLTTDGKHWNQVKATATHEFYFINRLAISADGKVCFAATSNPENWELKGAIFRSDDKEHSRWTKTFDGQFVDVECHPTDPDKVIAATDDGNVYYSDEGGNAGKWQSSSHANPWSGRVELAYCRKNPAIIYASVNINHGEIWRSKDGGKTFERRASEAGPGELANYLDDQGDYDNCIWAGDPTNEDFVIVGGINLFRSTDGGDTLVSISDWVNSKSAYADNHAIVASPGFNGTTNKTVFFGNDGGIYKTDDVYTVGNDPDRENGWINLNNDYGVTQFYGAAGNGGGMIVAGAQDIGTLRYDPGDQTQKWKAIFGGDGGFCAADPTANSNILYGEYVFADVHRSLDGGATESKEISGTFWDGKTWCWKPTPYTIDDAQFNRALFIAPFILDPNDSARLLVGGGALWRTNDAKADTDNTKGPTWKSIKPAIEGKDYISAIAVAPGDPDVIWVGHTSGRIFKTTNGLSDSPQWKGLTVSRGGRLRRYCHRLAIDPRDHKVVFATFGGYRPGNIWKTDDGGSRWIQVNDPLPQAPMPVRDLAIHPSRSDYLYLATEVGVFASEDTGKTWSPTNEGPTSCCVDQLFWMDKTLVAVTFGRGIFTIDLSKIPSPNSRDSNLGPE